MKKSPIILCDIDGTVANIEHRRHYISDAPCSYCADWTEKAKARVTCMKCDGTGVRNVHRWDKFNEACIHDTPNIHVIETVMALKVAIGAQLWMTSGRDDSVKPQTLWQLNKFGVKHNMLLMRGSGDGTPDDELKERWLTDGTIPRKRVYCAFDDRDRVVSMWRRNQVMCFQVAPGDF